MGGRLCISWLSFDPEHHPLLGGESPQAPLYARIEWCPDLLAMQIMLRSFILTSLRWRIHDFHGQNTESSRRDLLSTSFKDEVVHQPTAQRIELWPQWAIKH